LTIYFILSVAFTHEFETPSFNAVGTMSQNIRHLTSINNTKKKEPDPVFYRDKFHPMCNFFHGLFL
jgi:hypothetical protein